LTVSYRPAGQYYIFIVAVQIQHYSPKTNSHCSFPSDLSGCTSRSNIVEYFEANRCQSSTKRQCKFAA